MKVSTTHFAHALLSTAVQNNSSQLYTLRALCTCSSGAETAAQNAFVQRIPALSSRCINQAAMIRAKITRPELPKMWAPQGRCWSFGGGELFV
jgi:hypothetical protein